MICRGCGGKATIHMRGCKRGGKDLGGCWCDACLAKHPEGAVLLELFRAAAVQFSLESSTAQEGEVDGTDDTES